MSRNLQALQQSDARPGEENVPAAPQPDLAASTPTALSDAQAPFVHRQVTERIAPRRKAPIESGEENTVASSAPPAAMAAADEVERLLASLGAEGTEEVVLLSTAPEWQTQAELVIQDFAPTLEVDEIVAGTAQAEDHPAVTEIELEFRPVQPRRAVVAESPPVEVPQHREALQIVEQQVRKAVRGPRADSIARPCAWETTIHADLAEQRLAAPCESLIDRWRADRGASGPGTLLVASLAQPQLAGEVVMRAATLLARRDDASVLVIDGDPDGALSRRLAIIGKPGLTELLAPQDAHGETIHATATPRLHVLPRGRAVWPATTTLDSVLRLLGELSHEYAWLIVTGGEAHSPPISVFARACSGTYAVVPLGTTDIAAAQERLACLQTAGARILGAIATE